MEATNFDAFVRSLGSPYSRRPTLKLLGGSVLAAFLAIWGDDAAAACRAPGKPCRRADQCCSGRCNRKRGKCGRCPAGQKFCAATASCIPENDCCGVCPSGETCCSPPGVCRDLRNDRDHCGTCNNSQCPGGAFCANGECGLSCSQLGAVCFTGCTCAKRIDAAHLNQKVCAGLGVFSCDTVTTCSSDADCDPATLGFRHVCVSDLCAGKNVCAEPCA